MTSIEYDAFYGCSSLNSVTIPESVTSIGDYAFSGCSSLTSITIPEGVTSIEYKAFYDCSSLTDVTSLAMTPPGIYSSTFSTYGTLHVLPGCGDAYRAADYWKNFTIVEDAVDPNAQITLSSTAFTLVAGETMTLTATVTPAAAVTWSSNNTSVATVSNGVVTAKAAGTAIITCKTSNGLEPKIPCTITVLARGDVDGNGSITSADVTGCLKFVLEEDVTDLGLYQSAADFNNNSVVNTTDAISIVRMAMNGNTTYSAVKRKANARNCETVSALKLSDIALARGGQATMDLDFADLADRFVSFQFDMYLPEGISVADVMVGDKANGHSATFVRREEGFTRVMCYSLDNNLFLAGEGKALHVVLQADNDVEPSNESIELRDIELVHHDVSTVFAECQSAGLNIAMSTDIAGISDHGSLRVETRQGRLILTATADVKVTVHSLAGMMVYKGMLTAGQRIELPVAPGVYMINGHKVMVK